MAVKLSALRAGRTLPWGRFLVHISVEVCIKQYLNMILQHTLFNTRNLHNRKIGSVNSVCSPFLHFCLLLNVWHLIVSTCSSFEINMNKFQYIYFNKTCNLCCWWATDSEYEDALAIGFWRRRPRFSSRTASTEWHWSWVFSKYLDFPCQLSFHQCYTLTYHQGLT
jgi:hypothetical protein